MGAWSGDTVSAAFFSHDVSKSSVAQLSGDSVLGDVAGVALDEVAVGLADVLAGCELVSTAGDCPEVAQPPTVASSSSATAIRTAPMEPTVPDGVIGRWCGALVQRSSGLDWLLMGVATGLLLVHGGVGPP